MRKPWLLLILLILLTVGSNLDLVRGDYSVRSEVVKANITSVNSPSVVRAGSTFGVDVNVEYQTLGGQYAMWASVGAANGKAGELARESTEATSTNSPPTSGSHVFGFLLRAYTPQSSEYDSSGKFAWQLDTQVGDGVTTPAKYFTVTIIPDNAEPYVKISVQAQGNWGKLLNEVSVNEMFVVGVTVDMSVGAGSSATLAFRNSPESYTDAEAYTLQDDGWWVHTILSGSPLEIHSFSTTYSVSGFAPMNPTPDWHWDFQVEVRPPPWAPSQAPVTEKAVLDLPVKAANQEWAAFSPDESSAETSVLPSNTFQVTLGGKYAFPGASSPGTLKIVIVHDNTLVPGGFVAMPNLNGEGAFSQIFTLTAPSTEGSFAIVARLLMCKAQSCNLVDHIDFTVGVTSQPDTAYAKIVQVQVNSANPPQDVTSGKPFDVNLFLKWHLPQHSIINLRIFGGILHAIASDNLPIGTLGDGDSIETIQVPASEIPPHNGIWKLAATAGFTYPNAGGGGASHDNGKSFAVNVVGTAQDHAGPPGSYDWAVTGISTSPVNPYMGTDVTFVGRVEVSTTDPLPQTVAVSYSLDGVQQSKDYVTYQPGMAFLSVSSPPWTPTPGQHTIRWEVDPDKVYNDPNRANNVMEATFIVTQTAPQPPPGQTQPPQLPGGIEPPQLPTGQAFDFYVTAVPTEQTVQSPVTYLVTVNVTAGTPQPVQLDLMGAPAGVSYYFSPPSGMPGFTSTLTVTAASTVPAGSYPLTINASSAGIVRYKPLVLNILKGPDYTLTITPDTVQVNPGQNATFNVAVSSDSGYGQLVNLIASDLPPGSTSQFAPSALAPTGQSTLTVQLRKDVAPGFYRITIVGSGVDGKRVSAVVQVQGQIPNAQATEATVNNLAIGILGLIVALVVVGGVLAVRRFRAPRLKVFCLECGAKISTKQAYCPKCGTKQERSG